MEKIVISTTLFSLSIIFACCTQDYCGIPDLTGVSEEYILNFESFISGGELKSPVYVTWNGEKKVLQIYLNGNLLYPENPHDENCPGVPISLYTGTYEFKLWEPGASMPEKSVWVNIVSDIQKWKKPNGIEWHTVPGDGCSPRPVDYTTLYLPYVRVDNGNPEHSTLIADAQQAFSINPLNVDSYIIHNITYAEKRNTNILEGEHTASYFFQIPHFSTGITVEGGLFIWVGAEKKDYGTAFQLRIDEQADDFGQLFFWSGTDWEYSATTIVPTAEYYYKITFIVDYSENYASIFFKDQNTVYVLDKIFSITDKIDFPVAVTVLRIQAECISQGNMKQEINLKDITYIHNY